MSRLLRSGDYKYVASLPVFASVVMSGASVSSCSLCQSLTEPLAPKNPENVIRGLKAAIHNPNVSETGKQHAAEQLSEMGVDPDETKSSALLGGHSVITTAKTTVHESGRGAILPFHTG